MNRKFRIPALIVVFLVILSLQISPHSYAIPSAIPQTASPTVRRALLIGINEYLSPKIPDLRGAVNDVEFISLTLSTKYGFSEENVQKLIDSNATRQGILDSLAGLERISGPDDIIYIHFSGHGSQVEDMNHDESDKVDETIVPYDGRTGGVADIADDELGVALSRFESPNIVVVLDSCHSGTATRSTALSTRSIPGDTRLSLYSGRPEGTRAVVPLISERHLLLTGATASQRALDGPIDGRYHGFFSYALGKTLGTVSPDTPVKGILQGIEAELDRIRVQFGNVNMPEPQLEAQESRFNRSIFPITPGQPDGLGNTKITRLPWLLVEPLEEGKALLKNAITLGAQENSTWLVYPPGEMEFAGESAVAAARVVEIRDGDALADLQPESLRISPDSRAIILSPGFPSLDLPVRFLTDSSKESDAVQASLQKLIAPLRVVDSGEFARFVIAFQGNSCRIFGSSGDNAIDEFNLTNTLDAVHRLTRTMSRSLSASGLLALVNPSSKIGIDIRVVGRAERQTDRQDPKRGVKVKSNLEPSAFRVREEGEGRTNRNSLQLEVTVSDDAYITIVDVDQEGGVNVLFPNQYQRRSFHPQGMVRAGERLRIPDSLEPGNLAGFNWDIGPPEGTDTIRVFASTNLETAEAIRRFVNDLTDQWETGSQAAANFVSFSKLHQELSTRGINLVGNLPQDQQTASNPELMIGDWNAASVTIVVRD